MNVDVEVATVIARPREEVAAFAGDPSNAPEWYLHLVGSARRHPDEGAARRLDTGLTGVPGRDFM